MNVNKRFSPIASFALITLFASGCSLLSRRTEISGEISATESPSAETEFVPTESKEVKNPAPQVLAVPQNLATPVENPTELIKSNQAATQSLIMELSNKIQSLEVKLTTVNSQLKEMQSSFDSSPKGKKNRATASSSYSGTLEDLTRHPDLNAGLEPKTRLTARDPSSGFLQDESIDLFRRCMILFEGKKYPESILAFSEFLEKYPDHTLSGAAQFYIADSYFHQNEYKLAIEEFEHLFRSYGQSSHLSDALRAVSIAEDQVGLTQEAASHRQLLNSLFPQSPAASTKDTGKKAVKKTAPQPSPTLSPELHKKALAESKPTELKKSPRAEFDEPPPTHTDQVELPAPEPVIENSIDLPPIPTAPVSSPQRPELK